MKNKKEERNVFGEWHDAIQKIDYFKNSGKPSATISKTAKEKCIGKWEKKLQKAKDQKARWGDSYWNNYTERIATYEEVIKDLKRC